MKKLSKRFLTLAIACVMAMMMAVPAFADNATQVPSPPTPVEMEVESSLKDVPLQSNGPVSDCYVVPQELILADQQKAKEEAASISLVIPRSVYWQTEGSSPYTYIAQTTNYTCGLACTQMALKNINGTLPSESVLLSELGTTSSAGTNPNKIPEVLNEHQSRGTYAVRWMGSHVTTDLFKPTTARAQSAATFCCVRIFCCSADTSSRQNSYGKTILKLWMNCWPTRKMQKPKSNSLPASAKFCIAKNVSRNVPRGKKKSNH